MRKPITKPHIVKIVVTRPYVTIADDMLRVSPEEHARRERACAETLLELWQQNDGGCTGGTTNSRILGTR